jgi:ligand-binding sensor domain-containing protein
MRGRVVAVVLGTLAVSTSVAACDLEEGINLEFTASLYTDKDGGVWAGSLYSLARYEPQRGVWRTYHPRQMNRIDGVTAITQDSSGALWFATRTAIYKYGTPTRLVGA